MRCAQPKGAENQENFQGISCKNGFQKQYPLDKDFPQQISQQDFPSRFSKRFPSKFSQQIFTADLWLKTYTPLKGVLRKSNLEGVFQSKFSKKSLGICFT